MNDEKLWELVSLKLSGEATPEDLNELDSVLNKYPELHFKMDVLEQVWKRKKQNEVPPKTEDAFNKHLQRLSNHFANPTLQYENSEKDLKDASSKNNSSSLNKQIFWLMSIAAAAIVAVILIYQFNNKKIGEFSQNIVATKSGSKSKIILPDGTQVWLNSDSKITYDENYGKVFREVALSGEAYFDVVKDKDKPFIIHSKSIDVKVLGTVFNVRSYPDETTSETSLIRGMVEVTLRSNPAKKIILQSNEKLVVRNETAEGKQRHPAEVVNQPMLTLSNLRYFKGDSTAVETSWIKNKLAFDEESFELVARKIEKWYGVNISIKDSKLKNAAFTGVFEDETLTEVMEALKLTGNFSYSINKKEVIVTP